MVCHAGDRAVSDSESPEMMLPSRSASRSSTSTVGLGAELESVAIGAEDAIGDRHILAGAIAGGLQHDRIVTRDDFALALRVGKLRLHLCSRRT